MSSPAHKEEHHGVAHIASFKSLVTVFVLLVILTGVTYGASLIDFGSMNLVVAIGIAVVKSSLVVLYFMHLRYDKPFNSIVFVGCLIFVGLFISLALLDHTAYNKDVNHGQAELMKGVHTPGVFKPHEEAKPAGEGKPEAKPAEAPTH